jgi:hypothetical protein
MKKIRQQLKLELTEDCLYVSRVGNQRGHVGKRDKWKIKKESNLPRGLYFVIHNFVRTAVGSREGDDFSATKKAVLRGLCEAAAACGCELQSGKEGADLCWFLRGEPLLAFQIHTGEVDKATIRSMREGRAMFRWVITIKPDGFVRYHPRRTKLGVERAV